MQSLEQVRPNGSDARGDVVAGGVAPRHFQSRLGNIRGDDVRVGQLVGKRDGEAAGSRADVADMQSGTGRAGFHVDLDAPLAEAFERDFDDVLGFRTRDQHRRSDFEFQPPEFLLAR